MPRPKKSVPSYLHHKPTDRAYVRLPDGAGGRRTVYLGRFDSPESRAEYARLVAGLADPPKPEAISAAVTPAPVRSGVTVNEVLVAFLAHADRHYRRADGTATREVGEFKQVARALREVCGHRPAAEFGPLALKAVRDRFVAAGWCRGLVNRRVNRARHVFKWAAGEELAPAGVWQGLRAVAGLQAGRTAAPEAEPVGPVDDAAVEATLPHLPPVVAAMVAVQRLTGMRPGEVCRLRPAEIDPTGPVWVYRPGQHKTAHRGKARGVAIGPKAQAVLGRFAPADPGGYYFSPRRAVADFRAARAAARKTPRYPSHMARNAAVRVAAPKRAPADRYTVTSYGRAVARGVVRANARRVRLAGEGSFDPVPHWHPNQLRHRFATDVRRGYGLEAAQVLLGHAKADVTQVYAERNQALAAAVAARVG